MKTKQIFMKKLTKEEAFKKVECIKLYNTSYLDEAPNEPESEFYSNFVKCIASGLYNDIEEVVVVAQIVMSVKLI